MSDTDIIQPDGYKFIEKQRSVCYNYLLALTIAIGGFYLGYYLAIFNPIGD